MANKEPKYGEDGVRLCDQNGCKSPATYTFIWAQQGWACQCAEHTNKMLALESMLGFNIANQSVRDMTADEMLPDA